MQLNTHNFRQYLTKTGIEPHLSAWVLCAIVIAFLAFWSAPYIAPDSVGLMLPRTTPISLKNPPSAFVVYTGSAFIYQNRLWSFDNLAKELELLKDKKILLLAAPANTTVQQLLPVLGRMDSLGFGQVAFTVRP